MSPLAKLAAKADPTFKTPRSASFGALLGFVQAIVGLIFHLTQGHAQEATVMVFIGVIVTNGWALGESILRRAGRGRRGLVAALIAGNVVALGMGHSGCATFGEQRYRELDWQIDPDGPDGCKATITGDGKLIVGPLYGLRCPAPLRCPRTALEPTLAPVTSALSCEEHRP